MRVTAETTRSQVLIRVRTALGESTFHQTQFRDLPGRPASFTERAQWLALMRSSQSD